MSELQVSRALRVLALSFFAMGTASLSVVGALDPIASALAISRAQAALLVPAFAVTFAMGAPLLQLAARQWLRRRLLLGGLLMLAIGCAGCAAAPSYTVLLGARVLAGMGAAAVSPMVSSLATTIVPRSRQGHALAVAFSGITLASVLGVPFASWCAAALGWRAMFGAIALLAFAAFALVSVLVKDESRTEPIGVGELRKLLAHGEAMRALAVTLIGMTSLFTTYTMITPILRDRFAAGPDEISAALLLYGLAGVLGNWLARRIALRWTARRSIAAALALLIAGFAVVQFSPGWYALALAGIIPWAVAVDIFAPAQQRYLVELVPGLRGLVLALNSSALFGGMACGGALAGRVVTNYGLGMLAPVSIALALVCLLLLRGWSGLRSHVGARCCGN